MMRPYRTTRDALRLQTMSYVAIVLLLMLTARVTAQNRNASVTQNSNQSRTATDENRNATANSNVSSGSTNKGGASEAPKNPCPPPDAPAAKVKDGYKEIPVKHKEGSSSNMNTNPPSQDASPPIQTKDVELGDIVTVEVENLSTLVAEAKCANKHIVLYLDDRPIKSAVAYPPTDPNSSVLRFTLKRDSDSESVWTYVLGGPTWDTRPTKLTIGLEDKFGIPSDVTLNLKVIPHGWFAFWAIVFVVLLIAFFTLAKKSDLLRDSVPSPGGAERRPYSLARVQAAWWFFLVLASYLFIGMITGDFNSTITGTVLGLLGISAGTAVGSAFVDASKSTPESAQSQVTAVQSAQAQKVQLESDIADLKTNIEADQAVLADTTLTESDPKKLAATQDLTEKTAQLAAKQAEKTAKLSQ